MPDTSILNAITRDLQFLSAFQVFAGTTSASSHRNTCITEIRTSVEFTECSRTFFLHFSPKYFFRTFLQNNSERKQEFCQTLLIPTVHKEEVTLVICSCHSFHWIFFSHLKEEKNIQVFILT